MTPTLSIRWWLALRRLSVNTGLVPHPLCKLVSFTSLYSTFSDSAHPLIHVSLFPSMRTPTECCRQAQERYFLAPTTYWDRTTCTFSLSSTSTITNHEYTP